MRPYWTRLVAGILLGCFCGLMTGSFIWAAGTLSSRLEAPTEQVAGAPKKSAKASRKKAIELPTAWQARVDSLNARIKSGTDAVLDPWLPRLGVKIDIKRLLGGL